MTRKPVKILWGLIGICLLLGAVVSLLVWLGPKGPAWTGHLKEFSTLVDLLALVLWMLIFAFYWARHPDDENNRSNARHLIPAATVSRAYQEALE